jgi:hypothetical protein
MNLCACGNTAEVNGTLCHRCAALQVLELRAGASEREIKAAYRMLVKVWHPDRFQGDKALKDAADVKLKSINTAYVFLTSAPSMGGRWRTHKRPRLHGFSVPEGRPPAKGPAANRSATLARRAPSLSPARSTSRMGLPNTFKILFRFAIGSVGDSRLAGISGLLSMLQELHQRSAATVYRLRQR